MSINDLRELSILELETKVSELKKELMESRFSLATSQIEDTSIFKKIKKQIAQANTCLLYTSPSPRDLSTSRMPSSA